MSGVQATEWYIMIHKSSESVVEIDSVSCPDREREYFVATTGTTLNCQTIYRERWGRAGNVSKKTKFWNNTTQQRHGLLCTIDVAKTV